MSFVIEEQLGAISIPFAGNGKREATLIETIQKRYNLNTIVEISKR